MPLCVHLLWGLTTRPDDWLMRTPGMHGDVKAQCQRAAASRSWHRQMPTHVRSCIHRVRQKDARVALAGAQQLRLAARQINNGGALCHLRQAAGQVVQLVLCMLLAVHETPASPRACALQKRVLQAGCAWQKRTVMTASAMALSAPHRALQAALAPHEPQPHMHRHPQVQVPSP